MMMDNKATMEHIKEHVTYPATADDLKKACAEMSDFSKEEKDWFMKNR